MQTRTDTTGSTRRLYWIVVPATLGIVLFYYLVRPDTVGVLSSGSWTPITSGPVPRWGHYGGAVLLLAVFPLAAAWVGAGVSPRAMGLGIGRWREGLIWLAVGVPLAIIAGRIAAGSPVMRAIYPLYPEGLDQAGAFWAYAALQLLYYGAWETLFRGVLLFGLKDDMGDHGANLLQTGISVTSHFGRATTETLSALPAGLIFGAVALRTRSIWYVAIIHWTVGVSMDWFIVHGVGGYGIGG